MNEKKTKGSTSSVPQKLLFRNEVCSSPVDSDLARLNPRRPTRVSITEQTDTSGVFQCATTTTTDPAHAVHAHKLHKHAHAHTSGRQLAKALRHSLQLSQSGVIFQQSVKCGRIPTCYEHGKEQTRRWLDNVILCPTGRPRRDCTVACAVCCSHYCVYA